MKLKLIFIVFFALISCKKEAQANKETNKKEAATVNKTSEALEVYDFNGLEKFLNFKDDKTYVVNFWLLGVRLV